MGLLAGSTIMLLTVLWGSCVIVGKCDLVDSKAVDSTDTKGYSLTGISLRFSFSFLVTYENQRAGSATLEIFFFLVLLSISNKLFISFICVHAFFFSRLGEGENREARHLCLLIIIILN
jgi:hypothetical protein